LSFKNNIEICVARANVYVEWNFGRRKRIGECTISTFPLLRRCGILSLKRSTH